MHKKVSGFTIVELLVVVVIIGILATIVAVASNGIRYDARNSQRSSRITVVAEALEKYYDKNGQYPACNDMTANVSVITTNTLKGLDKEVLAAPGVDTGTNSFTCNTAPDDDTYSYYGGITQYTLKYKKEGTVDVVSLDSRRRITLPNSPSEPAMTVGLDGGNVLATITTLSTCTTGSTVQYSIRSRINEGTWEGWTAWSSATTASQIANYGVKYGYQARARCYVDDILISNIVTSIEASFNNILYTLTTIAGANGTTSGGGSYASGSTPTITASANAGYRLNSWSGSVGCSGIASHAITMNDNKTCTASFESYWIPGRVGSILAGKFVYSRNLTSTDKYTDGSLLGVNSWSIQWMTSTTCESPQCTVAGPVAETDSYLVGSPVLVSNNAVDFKLGFSPPRYPARDACKAIGGRLPTVAELIEIRNYRATTYENYFPNHFYWSATYYNLTFYDGTYESYAVDLNGTNDLFIVSLIMPRLASVRCVK